MEKDLFVSPKHRSRDYDRVLKKTGAAAITSVYFVFFSPQVSYSKEMQRVISMSFIVTHFYFEICLF